MVNQKGNLLIILAVIILLIATGVGSFYLGTKNSQPTNKTPEIDKSVPANIYEGLEVQAAEIQAVANALNGLATKLELSHREVNIIKVEKVVWPDTCMGLKRNSRCGVAPSGGVPGYKVTFSASGKEYKYHTGGEFYGYAGPGSSSLDPFDN